MIAGRPWLVPVAADPDIDNEAWLESRIDGIGGSDAAAIVGEDPERSAIDVWSERLGGRPPHAGTERAEAGRLLEPVVLGWYERGAPHWPREGPPLRIVKPPTVYHRDRPWHRGSADGLAILPEAIAHLGEGADLLTAAPASSLDHLVEVKTHGWFASRAYIAEDGAPVAVPPSKRIQCAWYMALYEVSSIRLLALVDTHIRRTFVIHRDIEIETSLLEQVERFWRRHVLTGDPPDPDGSTAYRRYLAERFRKPSAELVPSTPKVEAAVARYLAVRQQIAVLNEERERLEQVVKLHIGDADGVRTEHGVVAWRLRRSGKLNESAARAELYSVAGWTDDEILAFEARHARPEHRVFQPPTRKP